MKLRLNHFNFIRCLFGVAIALLPGNVYAKRRQPQPRSRLMSTVIRGR